jgi:hypothetical protein
VSVKRPNNALNEWPLEMSGFGMRMEWETCENLMILELSVARVEIGLVVLKGVFIGVLHEECRREQLSKFPTQPPNHRQYIKNHSELPPTKAPLR